MTQPVEPLLRTLSPLLHTVEQDLRAWMAGPRRRSLPMIRRAAIDGMATDLKRQSEALDVDRPILVVMLMGGTGVGKSTLMNALAGAPVAQASFARPTTRDPVVYYHRAIKPDRLDPALRHCRLAPHDRDTLMDKVIVDTPDLDSNDLENRDKLAAMLPVADIVLYVGSQEKYHDRLGWELFKDQRKRRAFAFVLNKWDRCTRASATGLRPDEDLLRDLKDEGFEQPVLFRTTAQRWVDAADTGMPPADLVPGEQFSELRNWLELGLSRLEIEAVKVRGVDQLLEQLSGVLEQSRPDDLTDPADRTRSAWQAVLTEEAEADTEILVGTLEPYAAEIEHHFRVQGQGKFRGLMSAYFRLVTKLRYAGTTLRDRLPLMPKTETKIDTPAAWNLAAFAHECTRVAGERALDQRTEALVNRLLVEADRHQIPPALISHATGEAGRSDWQTRYDRSLMTALAEAERNVTKPTGVRKALQVGLIGSANFLPELVFIASLILLLWRYFMESEYRVSMFDLFLPFALTLITLVLLHLLITVLLPMRWSRVRGEFQSRLREQLVREFESAFLPIPGELATALRAEREKVDHLIGEVDEVKRWLRERQDAARIAGLYGN